MLAHLHRQWEHRAQHQWPWLERSTGAAEAIGELYDTVWATARQRRDVGPALRDAGDRYVGLVARLEREETAFGRLTLIHGDASSQNMRSSADEIALVDWEDVRLASGAIDLAWYLVSSVEPAGWDLVLDTYAPDEMELTHALPGALTQGILALADHAVGAPGATGWSVRLEEGATRLR